MLCDIRLAEGKGMGAGVAEMWKNGWSWAREFCLPGILGGIPLGSLTDSFAAGTVFDHGLKMLLQRECCVSRQHEAGHGG